MSRSLRERLGCLPSAPVPPAHLGLYWRPSRETDSWRIRELIHLTEQNSNPARPTSEGEISRLTRALTHPELQDCLIGLDSRGNLAAFGSVTLQPDEKSYARADLFAVTAEHWRGRGIGKALLAWQDVRARELMLGYYGSDYDRPAQIRNVVDERAGDRRMLYAAAGFSAQRTIKVFSHHLAPDVLADLLGSFPTKDVRIVSARRLSPDQWEEIKALHVTNSARLYADKGDASRWWGRVLGNLAPDLSFAAVSMNSGRVLAYCLVVYRDICQSSCLDSEGTSEQIIPTVAVDIFGDDRQNADSHGTDFSVLKQVLSQVLTACQRLGYKQVFAEDNYPTLGDLSRVCAACGFQLAGARMIYTVEL